MILEGLRTSPCALVCRHTRNQPVRVAAQTVSIVHRIRVFAQRSSSVHIATRPASSRRDRPARRWPLRQGRAHRRAGAARALRSALRSAVHQERAAPSPAARPGTPSVVASSASRAHVLPERWSALRFAIEQSTKSTNRGRLRGRYCFTRTAKSNLNGGGLQKPLIYPSFT